MSAAGYFPSPWPAEDGGPQRLATPSLATQGFIGLKLLSGDKLACVSRRTQMSTMTILGEPGEVFLLHHSAVRAQIGLPTTSCVERIDPVTLRTLDVSPRLPGGPMWPGGMAVHCNGNLYVAYGRHLHRLDRNNLRQGPTASLELPVNLPYNSFVVLDNGLIVTKNISDTRAATLTVVDPQTMQRASVDVECPEPSIARLSSIGNTVYVVGVRSIFRYHWSDSAGTLERDAGWHFDYVGTSSQTYGWDVVLEGQNAWFMDNGRHNYLFRMQGAGMNPTPNRLIRVSMQDCTDHHVLEISSDMGGSVTNPPVFDSRRQIVVGFDSANNHLRAWRFDAVSRSLKPLWHRTPFGASSHMVLFPQTGELVTNDYRRFGEEVVVLDIETGAERARVRTPGHMQGVVFPSVGWGRDVYWCSMDRVTRVFVQ